MIITGNQAAWQTAAKTRPPKVGPGPTPDPAENEVVIKVYYAAVNSCDWNIPANLYFVVDYPFIWGTDVAGTIVQFGVNVIRPKLGQRVIGFCDILVTRRVPNSEFQLYITWLEVLVAEVPDSLPLANAAIFPNSVFTAASVIFIDHKLPFLS